MPSVQRRRSPYDDVPGYKTEAYENTLMAGTLEASEPDGFSGGSGGSALQPFRLLWHRKWLALLGVMMGCMVGAIYYARATPVYQSFGQVLVVKKTPDTMPLPGQEGGRPVQDDYLATHQILIRSPLIVGAAVKESQLTGLKTFTNRGDPTADILSGIKVWREVTGGTPTSILNISYRCADSDDSAAVVKAVIESYSAFLQAKYKDVSDETYNMIKKASEILEKKLVALQEEYDQFTLDHPGIWRGKDGTTTLQERFLALEGKRSMLLLLESETRGRLEAFRKATTDGRYSTLEIRGLISQMQRRPGGDTNPNAMTPEDRLLALEFAERALLEDYGPDHPKVQSLRKQMELLKSMMGRANRKGAEGGSGGLEMSDLVKSHTEVLKLELANIQQAHDALNDLIKVQQDKAKPYRALEKKDEALRSQILRNQQLFDAVAKRLDEASLMKNFTGGYDAETISPPRLGNKVWPTPVVVFGAAALLGLLVGFGLAYLAELSDQSFKTPDEIRRRLGLPVVGHIPFFTPQDSDVPAEGPLALLDASLCTVFRPKSREAEAYRAVRTGVFFHCREGGHKIVQITSSDMGDGKSTLSSNLAVCIAQAGKKVILMDADLRRPRVHKLYGLENKQGVATVLSGEAELDDVILPSGVPGLSILPAGGIPPNPAEMLSLPRFQELLELLRERYDYVLVDTPPLLVITDPCIVVPHVDGVLLTVRISKNARPHATRAKEILTTLNAKVIGVVVNGVGVEGRGYGYYYGYRYGYTYKYYNYRYQTYYENEDGEANGHGNGDANGNGHADPVPAPALPAKEAEVPPAVEARRGLLGWLFDR